MLALSLPRPQPFLRRDVKPFIMKWQYFQLCPIWILWLVGRTPKCVHFSGNAIFMKISYFTSSRNACANRNCHTTTGITRWVLVWNARASFLAGIQYSTDTEHGSAIAIRQVSSDQWGQLCSRRLSERPFLTISFDQVAEEAVPLPLKLDCWVHFKQDGMQFDTLRIGMNCEL